MMVRIRKAMRSLVRSHLPLTQALIQTRRLLHRPGARDMMVLFHVGRCGSTVLADLLNQHRELSWGSELFNYSQLAAVPGFRPTREWIRAVIDMSSVSRRDRCFGFESRIHDFRPDRIPWTIREFVAFLEQLGFTRFVVLRRSNLLRIVISANVAGKTRQMQARHSPSEPTRVRVDPAEPWIAWGWEGSLVAILERLERFYAEVDEVLAGRRALGLTYETDIESDPRIAYGKVCALLGLEPAAVNVRLARANPFTIEQMISNYDEVAAALRGTRYEWMLSR